MKIQCDVCSKREASIFCCADEAALCDGCDQRVHHANKLASKHHRFSLLPPSPSHPPLCDICQEKRAILFCQQDRAIMCRDCELPLHTANEHTQKHNRFLLTGIKLSRILDVSISTNNGCEYPVPDFESTKKPTSISSEILSSAPVLINDELVCGGSTSSISEYLIETLPGWHFEDLILDSPSTSPFGLCKSANKNGYEAADDGISFLDVDLEKEETSEDFGIWVPQVPAAAATTTTTVFGHPPNFDNPSELVKWGNQEQEKSVTSIKVKKKMRRDGGFSVPQITQSVGSKRIGYFW